MPQYLPLPDGSSIEMREGESARDAWLRAQRTYPEAFAPATEIEPVKPSTIGSELKRGAQQVLSSMQTTGESIFLSPEEAAKRGIERGQAISQEAGEGPSWERIKRVYEQQGLLDAAGQVVSDIPKVIAGQGANLAGMAAAARLGAMGGTAVGGPGLGTGIGAAVGTGAYLLPQFFGSNIETQAREDIAAGRPVDIETGKALAAATGQAATEAAGTAFILGKRLLSTVLGADITKAAASQAAKAALVKKAEASLASTLRGGAARGLTEIPVEIAQQVIERAQAGMDVLSDDAITEYGNAAYQAGLIGPVLGGAGNIVERGGARKEVAREEAERQRREAEVAKAAAEAEAAKQAQFKQSDAYVLDVEQRFNAFNEQVSALREATKTKVASDDLAGKAEQKAAGQQLSELIKDNRDLINEYNAIKGKLPDIREKQRVAGMSPYDYMLEQAGEAPATAQVKGPATLPSDEELGFVPPELPTDAASRFVNDRIALAQEQVVEPQLSDYQSYLMTDRGMAERAVAERPAINGLSAKEQRQLYDSVESLIKLQKQAEAKAAEEKRLAQRKEEERQLAEELKTRQELLQAQKPAKAVDTRMRTFLEQTDELAALYPESERREDAIFGRFFDPTQRELVASDSPAPSAALGQMQQRLTGQDVTYTGEDTGRTKGRVIPAADVGLSLFPTPSGGEAVTKESLSARIERLLNRDDISDEARALLERAAPAVQRGDTTLEQARRGAGEYGTASSNFYGLLDEQLSAIESGREGIVRAGAPRSFPERLQAFPTGAVDSSVDVEPAGFAGPRQPGVGGLRDRVTQGGVPKELKKTADALGPETIRGKSAGVNAPLSRARELSEVLAVGEQAVAGGSRVNELRQLLSAQEQALAGETDPGIRTAYERAIARTQQQLADAQKKPQAREEVQRELSPEMTSGKGTIATTRAAFMAVQRAQLGKAEKEAKAAAAEIAKLEAKIAPAKAALQKVYGQLHTVTESLAKFDEIKEATLSKLDLANKGISAFEARVQEARVAARKAAALEANAAPAFAKIDAAVAGAEQQVADLEAQLNALVEQTGVTRAANGDLQAMRMQDNGVMLPIDPTTAAAEERVLVYNVQSINKVRSRLRVAQQRLQQLSAQREAVSGAMNWYRDRAESMSSAPKLQAILEDIKQQAAALEADLAKPKTEMQTLLEARRVELENARATIERDLGYLEQQTKLETVEEKTVEKAKPTAGRVTADASLESIGKKMANLRLKMWDAFYDGVLSKAGVRIRALTEAERIERGLDARKTLEETGVAMAKIRKARANTEAKALASKGGYNKYDAMLKWIDMELGRANKALFDATQKAGAARNKSLSYLSVDDGALAPTTRFEGPTSLRVTYKPPVTPTRNVVAFKGMGEALREHSKHSMYIEALESEREAVLRDMLADKPRALSEAAEAASPRAGTAAELEAIDRAFENQQLLASMPPRIKAAQLELEEALAGTDKKKQDSSRKALVDLLAEQQALLKTADRGRTGPAVRSTSSAPAKMRTGLLEFAEARRTSTKKPVSDAAMAVPNRAMSAKEQREANRIAEDIRTKLSQEEANRIAEALRKKTDAQKAKEAREAAAVAKELAKLRQEWASDDDLASAVRDSDMYDGRPTTELNAATKEAVNDGRVLDVVDRLAADGSTPFVREVAQRLRPLLMRVKLRVQENLTDSKGVPVEGLYNPATATVTMDKQAMTEEALMHELVHPATLAALDADPATLTPAQQQARADLEALVERIKGQPAFAKEYGATNTKEFVSELLSNQQLRDKLDQRNFLQRIYDALLRMIGITPKSVSAKAVEDAFTLFAPARPSQGAVVASVMRGVFPGAKAKYSELVPAALQERITPTAAKQSLGQKLSAAALGYRTLALDRWAPVEYLIKQGVSKGMLSETQAQQMRVHMRLHEDTNRFAVQALTNGVPQLQEENGKRFYGGKASDINIRTVVQQVSEAGVGNNEAALNMWQKWMEGNRIISNKLDFDVLDRNDPKGAEQTFREIDAIVKANPKVNSAFEKARATYRQYNKDLMRQAVEAGTLPKDLATKLGEADYIPFYRVEGDTVQLYGVASRPITIGSILNQPYLKELIGDEKGRLPALDAIVQNTSLLTKMNIRNLQAKETANMLQSLGLGKIIQGEGPLNTLRFKSNGLPYWIKLEGDAFPDSVTPEMLLSGMQGIKTAIPQVIKTMAVPTRWLRNSITRMPMYVIRQMIRDPLFAWLTTGGKFTPVVSSIKELTKIRRGFSPTEETLARSGAISSNVMTGDYQDMARALSNLGTTTKGVSWAMAGLDNLAIQADASTRAVLYDSFRKQGLDHVDALLGAAESMNFSRRGTSSSLYMMSAVVPFFNAQLQGIDAMYRAIKGDTVLEKRLDVRNKLAQRGALMLATTLAYAAAMQDDEAYKNATPQERAMNWFVRVPGLDEAVRIPIPFEPGLIFKAVPEAIANAMFGDDTAKDAVKAIRSQLWMSTPLALPTAINPLVELATNYSFFNDRPIESTRERAEDPSYRYREGTTELAKLLGKTAGVSPLQIEHLVRGYFSSAGIMLMSMANYPLRPFVSPEGADRAELKLSQMPVLGPAFQPDTGRGAIDAAFADAERFQQASTTFKRLLEKGETAQARSYAAQFSREIALASTGGAFTQQMGEFAKMKRAVAASSLSPEEKRSRIDQIRKIEITLAQQIRKAGRATSGE